MTRLTACYGTGQAPVVPEIIAFSDWQLELVNGELKNICFQQYEVIRSIGFIIRDKNWGTLPLHVEKITRGQSNQALVLTITARGEVAEDNRVELTCQLTIAQERVNISADLIVNHEFSAARCGFIVLYPLIGVVGSAASIIHADNSVEHSHFPVLIEPWQPFKDIAELHYQHSAGVSVSTHYSGDIFEMEDQRAWMDASYKVYSRPLAKPWPYPIAAGTIRQSITLHAKATSTTSIKQPGKTSIAPFVMPSIGVLIDADMLRDKNVLAEKLADLQPGYILYHFNHAKDGLDALTEFAFFRHHCASTAPLHIEYVLPIVENEDYRLAMQQFADALKATNLHAENIIISPSTDLKSTPPGSQWPWCPPLEDIFKTARTIFSGINIGGGMISYFTELNRKRPPLEWVNFVTHAVCPIVHDAADRPVMQTLETLPFITQSTRQIIGNNMPYHLGPTMLSMRDNPYGAEVYANPDNIRMTMTHSDPRQKGLFFASWLVGFLAKLIDSKISHWCPAGLSGGIGLGEVHGNALTPFPAWHIVKFLAGQKGHFLRQDVNQEENIIILEFEGSRRYWLLANLSDRTLFAPVPDDATTISFKLDENKIDLHPVQLERMPISLAPYSVACLSNT